MSQIYVKTLSCAVVVAILDFWFTQNEELVRNYPITIHVPFVFNHVCRILEKKIQFLIGTRANTLS